MPFAPEAGSVYYINMSSVDFKSKYCTARDGSKSPHDVSFVNPQDSTLL